MKAIIYTEYGGPDVLKLAEVAKPNPKEKEVLIRIRAVSVNYGDILARNFKNIPLKEFNMPWPFYVFARMVFGIHKPKRTILGNSFAGEINAVGNAVTRFKKGDLVFGHTAETMRAYAEYISVPENGLLAVKPINMGFEEASTVPYGALTALDLLRKAKIKKGQKVLIVGASGSIGAAAMQLAKRCFEADITGVCGTASLTYVKLLSGHNVIDYQKEDFTKNGKTYDLIFDILGRGSFSKYKTSLQPDGVYFSVSFKIIKLFQMLWTSIAGGKKVKCALANPKPEDLVFLKNLIEASKFKSIIDKQFPLEQTAAAHQYVEKGNKMGHVVITV